MANKLNAAVRRNETISPAEEVEKSQNTNKKKPDPDTQVDFLVEEVDWEDTLHCVTMHVAHGPDLEVTHCAFREEAVCRAFLSEKETRENTEAVDVEVFGNKQIENVDLKKDVEDVEKFGHQVKNHEEIPTSFAAK